MYSDATVLGFFVVRLAFGRFWGFKMETRIMLTFLFSAVIATRVEVQIFHFIVLLCQFCFTAMLIPTLFFRSGVLDYGQL